MPTRVRLDELVSRRGLAPSRERARSLVLAGRVEVNGQRVDKAGTRVAEDAPLQVRQDPNPFVSRGGLKLAAALPAFGVDVAGLAVLDVGASTGGFTHCLLEAGARQVVALDVGHGQLDWGLRNDPRVAVVERFNARYLDGPALDALLPAPLRAADLSLAVVDVSFISLDRILPALARLASLSQVVCLIKPQFEVGRGQVGKGGIVRDAALHLAVLQRFQLQARAAGWRPVAVMNSPVTGAEGNREFLAMLLRLSPASASSPEHGPQDQDYEAQARLLVGAAR